MSITVWTVPDRPSTGQNITENFTFKVFDDLDFLHNSAYPTEDFRNLYLRTDPTTAPLSRVMLTGASEIVMNDGFRSGPWTSMLADITATGAGGLDTGAEASSTWYEIHAIAKDDGTKNLLYHVAPTSPSVANQLTDNTSEKLRQGASDRVKLAQGFQSTIVGPITFVDLEISQIGTIPSGTVFLTVEGDTAGSPNGTPLCTSDTVNAASVQATAQKIRFFFRTPATLALTTQYHLVLQGTYTASATNYIAWGGNTANAYANGSAKKFDGTTWAAAVGPADFYFNVGVLVNPAVTMPATYTRRCKIGYVYNNAGGNFQAFIAKDNFVKNQPGTLIGPVTNTTPVLYNINDGGVPYALVEVYLMHAGSVAGDQTTMSGAPDGYATVPSAQYVHAGTISSAFSNCPAPILTESQAIWAYRSAGTGNFTLANVGYRW